MAIRIVLLLAIAGAFGRAGEHRLTGNFRIDLLAARTDSVSMLSVSVIDDARYQSPLMNGLYSLAVPGAGQWAAERYTKSLLFFGAEVALIAYAMINDDRGDKKTAEFQQYAEAHWSPLRYARWIERHGVADYGPNLPQAMDYAKVSAFDFSQINAWERGDYGAHKEGFSHTLPEFRSQQYYELIGKYHQFKFGWDTYPDVNNDGIPDSDGGVTDNMIPQQLKDYAEERGKANDYYYAASFAVSVLVINHVASAVDAFLSTKNFNKQFSASLRIVPDDTPEGKRLRSAVSLSVGF